MRPGALKENVGVSDAVEQFAPIGPAALFQAIVVERETLDHVFSQHTRRPLAKANTFMRFNSITDRDNDIEIVMIDLVSFTV